MNFDSSLLVAVLQVQGLQSKILCLQTQYSNALSLRQEAAMNLGDFRVAHSDDDGDFVVSDLNHFDRMEYERLSDEVADYERVRDNILTDVLDAQRDIEAITDAALKDATTV